MGRPVGVRVRRTRTGARRRPIREEEGDFRSPEAGRRAAKGDGAIAEPQAGESPPRHHLNNEREFGLTPDSLFF